MKNILAIIVLICCCQARAQSFTPGNLVILRQGDGVQTLTNTGNTVFLDEYVTNGTLYNSTAIADSGPNAVIQSGAAGSEGQLTRSPDGRWLGLAGYNVARPYTNSLASAASSLVPRVAVFVDYLGQVTVKTTATAIFSGNNIRAGLTDGTNFWAGGASASGGYGCYRVLPGASAGLSTLVYNARAINIFNGNLYLSTQAAGNGIWAFAGVPTNAAALTQVVATGDKSNPVDFAFNPAGTTLYVADDQNSGGVQRWDKSGSSWSLSYVFTNGYGARSLTVDFSGAHPVIYTITGGSTNRLMQFVDTGSASAGTVLATPAANTAFRGVRFAPAMPVDAGVAAPGSLAPGGIVTNTLPVLQWAAVADAIGYDVTLTLPSGLVKSLEVDGATNVTVPLTLVNGIYTWTVSAFSAKGSGPAASGSFVVQSPLPSLRAVQSSTNVLVSWPLDTVPATLINATNLASTNWTAVTQSPVQTNGEKVVAIPIGTQPQYFRLRISP